MALDFEITIEGYKEFKAVTAALLKYYSHELKEDLEWFAEQLRLTIEQNFIAGGPPGHKWPDLSGATETKQRLGLGYYSGIASQRPLIASGSLLESLARKGGRYHVDEISASRSEMTLRFGSLHPLATVHHSGLVAHRGPIHAHNAKALIIVYGDVIFFSASVGPATIRIPARPFYSNEQIFELADSLLERISQKTKLLWI